MKPGCIGKDIDGVQLTTSSLFGYDGVVTFTSRLLATVFKRVFGCMGKTAIISLSSLPV